jgi:hypothetical protein
MSKLRDKSIAWLESAMWEGREAGLVVFKEMERRLAEAQATIERMQTVVDAAVDFDHDKNMEMQLRIKVRDYEAKEKP